MKTILLKQSFNSEIDLKLKCGDLVQGKIRATLALESNG